MFLALTLASASPGLAQVSPSQIPQNLPPDTPYQTGPFYLAPTIGLKDVGVDTNVFNDQAEEQDFTATPTAAVDATSLIGPFRLATNLAVDYVWYQTFESQRALNTNVVARLEAYLDRVRPWASVGYSRSRTRRGFEIDPRVQRQLPTFGTGVDWVLGSRTALALSAQFQRPDYAEDATVAGVSLADQLSGDEARYRAGLLFDLTPLTTFRIDGERGTATFDGGSVRNNDSWSVLPALLFQPDAAISGQVMVGYRSLTPKNTALESFQGLVADGSLVLDFWDVTQFQVEVSRDVEYSFDELHPYYVQSGGRLVVTQQIGGPFEVVLLGGLYDLAYRDLPDVRFGPRGTERRAIAGAGVGYRLGDTVRIGLDAQFDNRRAESRPNRDYDRVIYYGSIIYSP